MIAVRKQSSKLPSLISNIVLCFPFSSISPRPPLSLLPIQAFEQYYVYPIARRSLRDPHSLYLSFSFY